MHLQVNLVFLNVIGLADLGFKDKVRKSLSNSHYTVCSMYPWCFALDCCVIRTIPYVPYTRCAMQQHSFFFNLQIPLQ